MTTTLMTNAEKSRAGQWLQGALGSTPPFTLRYDGIPSARLLNQWLVNRRTIATDDGTIQHSVIYRDAATGLECELELTEYPESPTMEWLVRFRNTGTANTPIISEIQALDMVQKCSDKSNARLYYSKGTQSQIDDFALQQRDLALQSEITLAALGVGSSRTYLPFFNLETEDEGVIIAIGWTGNWACSFQRQAGGDIAIQAGLTRTHLTLHPGEEIRTPRILLLFWQGDRQKGHNLLRRHLVAHHLPRSNGQPVEAPIGCLTWGGLKTHNHLKMIQFIRDHGLKYDYYWLDAGWFGPDHETDEFQNFHTEDWAYQVGHWRVNRAVHPDGLRPIVEAAHAAGMKVLLWLGPYLAEESSPLMKEHPEWANGLSERGVTGIGGNPKPVRLYELNLGLPAAQRGLTTLISDLIREHQADCYRDDCHIGFATDEPDRQGMSEIKSITGFYAIWDELLKRHPGLLIDNCGGGASRLDLETIGRSLILWRSDYNCDPAADPIASQVGTYGLSHWLPLVGGAPPVRPGDTYNFRSAWSGGLPFGFFHTAGYGTAPTAPIPDYPIEWHRQMMEQYRRARQYYTGDFYPLTDCTLSTRDWLAYQMDRPDFGGGIVMAFRRKDSPFTTAEFQLQGLDAAAEYEIENADTGERTMSRGAVTVTMKTAPASTLLFYKRSVR